MLYRYFDLIVDSEIRLPDLEEVHSGKPDLCLKLCYADVSLPRDLSWNYVHRPGTELQPNPGIGWSFAWNGRDLLFAIPRCGTFRLEPSSPLLTCHPFAGTSELSLQSELTYNVIPRVMGELGHMVMHASCVMLEGIGAIVFAGSSGAGKSTLAASFVGHGAKFVSDDSVMLKNADGQLLASTASSYARLWDDSFWNLFDESSDATVVTQSRRGRKWKHRLAAQRPDSDEAPVAAVFHVATPEPVQESGGVIVERKSGAELLFALIDEALLFDTRNKRTRARRFLTAAQLAGAGPAFFTIRYPRQYAVLDQVHSAVIAAVEAGAVANDSRMAS